MKLGIITLGRGPKKKKKFFFRKIRKRKQKTKKKHEGNTTFFDVPLSKNVMFSVAFSLRQKVTSDRQNMGGV